MDRLEELKKKKKPKEPFDRLQVVTEPNEKAFIAPKPKKEDELGELTPEAPEEKVEDLEFALRRYIKPGHWTGVLVTTTANNFDFGGELVSQPQDSSHQPIDWTNSAFRVSTARPAALAKGQRKTLETLFFAPPRQGTLVEEGRLPPRRDGEQPPARLARAQRVPAVHVHAERAAVQHRRAQLDQFQHGVVHVLLDVLLQAEHRPVRLRCHRRRVHPAHGRLPHLVGTPIRRIGAAAV